MTRKDQFIGLFWSLSLHAVLLAGLVLFSVRHDFKMHRGMAIEAQIMDLDDLISKAPARKPPEVKQPEVKPPVQRVEPETQPPEVKPLETKPVESKPPDVKPVPTEQKPPERVQPKIDEALREKQLRERTERQKRLEEIRKKRLEAEQKLKQQQQQLAQIEQQNPTVDEPSGNPPVGDPQGENRPENRLRSRYLASIKARITNNWSRPASARNVQCTLHVKQIPGGGVIDASIGSPCVADAVVRNSILNAVRKSDPLPYQGFESVFDRNITIDFIYNQTNE